MFLRGRPATGACRALGTEPQRGDVLPRRRAKPQLAPGGGRMAAGLEKKQ